jgi:hypothetical protein
LSNVDSSSQEIDESNELLIGHALERLPLLESEGGLYHSALTIGRTIRARGVNADPWAAELQDHAIGVLQLNASSPRRGRRLAERFPADQEERFQKAPLKIAVGWVGIE